MANRIIRRPGKTIDYKQWVSIPLIELISASSQTVQGASIAFAIPATILRCRGQLSVAMDETKQVGDLISIGLGLGIVSSDAFAAGAGSMPDPSGEPEYPWLWWAEFRLESFVAAGEEAWGTTARQVEFDTKSMRKVKPGQSLTWVVQFGGVAGAPVTNLQLMQTRVLIGT